MRAFHAVFRKYDSVAENRQFTCLCSSWHIRLGTDDLNMSSLGQPFSDMDLVAGKSAARFAAVVSICRVAVVPVASAVGVIGFKHNGTIFVAKPVTLVLELFHRSK